MINDQKKTKKKPQYKRLTELGFPLYRVGTDGSFWVARKRYVKRKGYQRVWKQINMQNNPVVCLSKQGRKRYAYLYHLILTCFRGPRPKGKIGCHKDDNRRNNRLSNLYWGTYKENLQDAIRNGRVDYSKRSLVANPLRGSQSPSAKLTDKQIRNLRKLYKEGKLPSQRKIAQQLNVSQANISMILSRKSWSHI